MCKRFVSLNKSKANKYLKDKKSNISYMNNNAMDQYPFDKFKKLTILCIDIVQNFLITLEQGVDYNSSSIAFYGEKYGSSQKSTKSKIETIVMNNMKTEEQMRDFLSAFYNALNSLNENERIIFEATYIKNMSQDEIKDEFFLCTNHIVRARHSATIKFCLASGLDKFINLI